ncbi:prepilin-type N-terminal cleavage/methylation domain-containing protein [Patescibacteria group bacterium]|nr:prepilin-type N-terminal cleavage/methylation domain-containing protein [Patescibacteria group bacterium]
MNHKKPRGFTLIEVMIYVVLVSGILIGATSFAISIINNRTKSFAIQEVEQNSRFMLEKITQVIRSARKITTPAIGVTDTTLVLEMSDGKKNPTIFALDGSSLSMTQGADPTLDLHSGNVEVSNLTFTNLSSPNDKTRNVFVSFTLSHRNPSGRQEWAFTDSFEMTIELRDR